jgi:hypothetical protein
MTRKSFFLFQLAILAGLIVQARVNVGILYAPFLVKYNSSAAQMSLLEKTELPSGQFAALQFYTQLSRNSTLGFGAGVSQVNYHKQLSGIFPESNAFGMMDVEQRNGYWIFPVTFFQTAGRSRGVGGYSGIRLTYLPALRGRSETTVRTFAGAEGSSYTALYRNNSQAFQHSLLLAYSNQFQFGRNSGILILDPFIGIGSGYEQRDGMRMCTVSFGIQLGYRFSLPEISIELHKQQDSRKDKKKKELEQKQKEIEQQLSKPKTN